MKTRHVTIYLLAAILFACDTEQLYHRLEVIGGSGTGEYRLGQSATIKADPAPPGQGFAAWTGEINYLENAALAETKLKMPLRDLVVTATYKDLPKYTLTVQKGSGSGAYLAGTEVAIRADAPPTDDRFFSWTGDIQFVLNPDSAKTIVRMPEQNVNISAGYTPLPKYALTVVRGSGSGNYLEGAIITIRANIPANNERFVKWVGDVSYVMNAEMASTLVKMPAKPVQLGASFETVSSSGPTGVSFSEDVFPIITLRCATIVCHVPGRQDPPLSTYEEIKENAVFMLEAMRSGFMPPGIPLPQNEVDLISLWIDQGMKNN